MIDMARTFPHLTLKAGIWLCVGCRCSGVGTNPRAAYDSWQYFVAYHVQKRNTP